MPTCVCGRRTVPGEETCLWCGRDVAASAVAGPGWSRRSLLAVGASAAATLLVAFAVTAWRAGVGPAQAGALRPTAPAAAPSQPALPLSAVATAALSRVVTVESANPTGPGRSREELGTGWLFDDHGDFVTNWHVLEGHVAIRLRDRENRGHVGVVMGFDRTRDVALVRSLDGFSGAPLPPAGPLDPQVPQPVVVLASSRATQMSDVTSGTLVRVHEDVPLPGTDIDNPGDLPSLYRDMLGIDARVFRGNSGGPVLDGRAQVVGIVTLASASTPQAFAIPLARVLDELRAFAARPTPSG